MLFQVVGQRLGLGVRFALGIDEVPLPSPRNLDVVVNEAYFEASLMSVS